MRFDILFAMISSGLYAPLLLMAFGFVLAVGGAAFLLQRRKKTKNPANTAFDEAALDEPPLGNSVQDERPQFSKKPMPEEPPALTPGQAPEPAVGGRRRRSLVGGAERDEGTPAGAVEDTPETVGYESEAVFEHDETASELTQPTIEEAEFSEFDEDLQLEDAFPADDELDALSEQEVEADADHELEPAGLPSEDEEHSDDDAAKVETAWIEAEDEPEIAEQASIVTGAAGLAAGAVGALAGLDDEDAASPAPDDQEDETADGYAIEEADTANESTLAPIEISAEVAAALNRPIAFRQFLPQSPGKDGLSFFGGEPIGPADFQWPRERGAQGGAPLQFVMQWDCVQLAEADPTGLLPQDGVLYCFVNFERSDEDDFLADHVFIHHRGPMQAWSAIATPEDAGPALGADRAFALSGCTETVDNAHSYVPRALPRFPFAPIALNYPAAESEAAIFWSDDVAANALLEVQQSGVSVTEHANETATSHEGLGRPFPAFPHDFGAVRVIATRVIEALQKPDEFLAETLYPSLSQGEREAQFAAWSEEAKEVYLLGTQRPASQKLDQNIADDIWQWFEERKGMLDANLPEVIEEAVDLSLSASSEALGSVPPEWIDRAMHAHALAKEYSAEGSGHGSSDIRASTPVRMFGPASYGAGIVSDLARDHVLLLELPSDAGPGHHFGGKVLQYWITPDDLAAGKFDQVKATTLEPST